MFRHYRNIYLYFQVHFINWSDLVSNGWIIAIVALMASIIQSTFSQASTHLVAMEGLHVRSALQVFIYQKVLKLPNFASKCHIYQFLLNIADDSSKLNCVNSEIKLNQMGSKGDLVKSLLSVSYEKLRRA